MQENHCLRPVAEEDIEALHSLLSVEAVFFYLADGVKPERSIAAGWVDESLSDFERFDVGIWCLSGQTDGQISGLARLSDYDHGTMQLTYLLHPDMWGKGLATRMAHTALSMAFRGDHVCEVWAGADKPNAASISVMQRLGMAFQKDVQYPAGEGVEYRITRADFDPRRMERLPICT
ncbi:GNAT family N-acetyltransferase [Hoeflea poritis]|uniref:GNAT family N-acetyltransferase n=1 Tax=Hoeflea poritis TaxID=2993659 RepID=A0ABT4VV92_9HYPH|nr:GNAT family N-acetyltransferase [Hoeflea poritis]MDA4848643.1 GNAT family N-acetyltransferase [Hoeflea poritis]